MNAVPIEVGFGIMFVAVLGFFVVFLNWGPNPMNQAVMFQHPTGVVPAQVRDTRRRTMFRRVLWLMALAVIFLAGLWGVQPELAEFFVLGIFRVLWLVLTVIATVCETLADAIGGVPR
jgi:hypothetical protein